MNELSQVYVAELLAAQARAVDLKLRDILTARGVDPDDRSPGWADRGRTALADVEIRDVTRFDGPYRIVVETTVRTGQDDQPAAIPAVTEPADTCPHGVWTGERCYRCEATTTDHRRRT